MIKALNKPYPCNKSIIDNLFISILVGLFVFFFLFFFHPFDNLIRYSISLITGYGVITLIVSFTIAAIIPLFFSNYFNDNNWTVGKEIIHFSFIVFVIAVVNFFYSAPSLKLIEGKDIYTFKNFTLSLSTTFIVGIMPVIIVVLYNQTRLLKKYINESEKINNTKQNVQISTKEIVLNGEGKNEQLKIMDEHILFIKSESNYCEVYIKGRSQKHLLRGSLSSIEESLSGINSFIRVHRSYIVNRNNIDNITGTAQGYKLHFIGIEDTVPVSRNKSTEFKSLY